MKLRLQFDNGTEVTTNDVTPEEAQSAFLSVRDGDGYAPGITAVLVEGRKIA